MTEPTRIVTDSLAQVTVPDAAVWSERVTVILGQNPGPFTGPGTNTYLIGTGPRPLLLDTGQGLERYMEVFRRACREIRQIDGVQAIVLTHGHIDHVGGVRQLWSELGAVPVLKMPWPGQDPEWLSFEVLADGDVVRTDGATLRAIWTPGHARDHLCFHLEEENALFTGDVVLGAGTTVIPDDGDLGDYLRSLRRLLDLDVRVIYPAHGPAIRNPKEKIHQYLEHRELRERQILDCLRAGMGTPAEIVRKIYVDVPDFLHGAAAMSVRAHLRKLAAAGTVVRRGDDWLLR